METQERWLRSSSSDAGAPAPSARWSSRAGWVRCQVMGRPAEIWTRPVRDTNPPEPPTPQSEDPGMLKRARNRATEILSSSAELYREMALSALRLVRR